jgi:hypothetical protein
MRRAPPKPTPAQALGLIGFFTRRQAEPIEFLEHV